MPALKRLFVVSREQHVKSQELTSGIPRTVMSAYQEVDPETRETRSIVPKKEQGIRNSCCWK